jgi:transposase
MTPARRAIPYDVDAYRQRNRIERMFGRLKDFRRIATRYDKLPSSFRDMLHLAALRRLLRHATL